MNICVITGRIVKDVDIKTTNGAEPLTIARFTVAVKRMKKGEADFLPCVAFGKTAEILGKYCSNGSQVGVTGHIQTGSYTKQDGTKVYTTDVIVDKLDLLGTAEHKPEQPKTEAEQSGFYNIPDALNDGGLPFN